MRRILTFGAAMALAAWGMVRGHAAELQVGDEAPAFTLPGTDGKSYSLADYLNKEVVVVAWFPKAKTSGCTRECQSLRESGEALRKFEVAYFAASCDEEKENQEFAQMLGLDFPILSDPSRETAKKYGVVDNDRGFAKRWTFYIGKDGKILYIDKQVKTSSHGEDIAKKLEELGVPKRQK